MQGSKMKNEIIVCNFLNVKRCKNRIKRLYNTECHHYELHYLQNYYEFIPKTNYTQLLLKQQQCGINAHMCPPLMLTSYFFCRNIETRFVFRH